MVSPRKHEVRPNLTDYRRICALKGSVAGGSVKVRFTCIHLPPGGACNTQGAELQSRERHYRSIK